MQLRRSSGAPFAPLVLRKQSVLMPEPVLSVICRTQQARITVAQYEMFVAAVTAAVVPPRRTCRYLALKWAADFHPPFATDGGAHALGLQAQSMYHAFSTYMRRIAPVMLPVIRMPSSNSAGTATGASAAHLQRLHCFDRLGRVQRLRLVVTAMTVALHVLRACFGHGCN